jgi:predicted ATPase
MVYFGWARARRSDSSDNEIDVAELRKAIAALTALGIKYLVPFFQGLLAEIEAERQDVEQALARIDEALGLAQQTGEHWSDAYLHCIRGEILLKSDPANKAQAEEVFHIGMAIAREQKARSFELRAALSLARLYQSSNRATDAHAALAPALEGFLPTPELPEIAEAQMLLAALAP